MYFLPLFGSSCLSFIFFSPSMYTNTIKEQIPWSLQEASDSGYYCLNSCGSIAHTGLKNNNNEYNNVHVCFRPCTCAQIWCSAMLRALAFKTKRHQQTHLFGNEAQQSLMSRCGMVLYISQYRLLLESSVVMI